MLTNKRAFCAYVRVRTLTLVYFAGGQHDKALTHRLVVAPVILLKIWEAVHLNEHEKRLLAVLQVDINAEPKKNNS